MKPYLLLGAALMAGASVYGIMDYRKKTQHQDFIQMYQKEPATGSGLTATGGFPAASTTEATAKNETGKPEMTPARKTRVKKNGIGKKEALPRKLHRRMFSRGPLEDQFIAEEVSENLQP